MRIVTKLSIFNFLRRINNGIPNNIVRGYAYIRPTVDISNAAWSSLTPMGESIIPKAWSISIPKGHAGIITNGPIKHAKAKLPIGVLNLGTL